MWLKLLSVSDCHCGEILSIDYRHSERLLTRKAVMSKLSDGRQPHNYVTLSVRLAKSCLGSTFMEKFPRLICLNHTLRLRPITTNWGAE